MWHWQTHFTFILYLCLFTYHNLHNLTSASRSLSSSLLHFPLASLSVSPLLFVLEEQLFLQVDLHPFAVTLRPSIAFLRLVRDDSSHASKSSWRPESKVIYVALLKHHIDFLRNEENLVSKESFLYRANICTFWGIFQNSVDFHL